MTGNCVQVRAFSLALLPWLTTMSVQGLESAVARLSKEDLAQFARWFEAYLSDEWDRQIEADALAGRFEAAGKCAIADYEAGRCTAL